ncbi:Condensin complex subunit 3 [Apiospora arundinis]
MAFLSSRDRTRHHSSQLHKGHSNSLSSGDHHEYRCACGISFPRRDNYLRHLRWCVTPEISPHTCGNCGLEKLDTKNQHLEHLKQCQKRRGRKPKQT